MTIWTQETTQGHDEKALVIFNISFISLIDLIILWSRRIKILFYIYVYLCVDTYGIMIG